MFYNRISIDNIFNHLIIYCKTYINQKKNVNNKINENNKKKPYNLMKLNNFFECVLSKRIALSSS